MLPQAFMPLILNLQNLMKYGPLRQWDGAAYQSRTNFQNQFFFHRYNECKLTFHRWNVNLLDNQLFELIIMKLSNFIVFLHFINLVS